MMNRTRSLLVPFTLGVMGIMLFVLSGCKKEEEAPSYSPVSYMKDPVFREKLATKRKELEKISAELKPLQDRMQELVKEHGEDPAALQKIDEWNDLHQKVTALIKRHEELSKQQIKVLRNRITPTKDLSK